MPPTRRATSRAGSPSTTAAARPTATPPSSSWRATSTMPSRGAAPRAFKSEGFFEYHLYTLDGRTTIKDNQTKQLTLMAAADVPVVKQLIYYGAQDYYRTSYGMPMSNQKVGVYLDIKN